LHAHFVPAQPESLSARAGDGLAIEAGNDAPGLTRRRSGLALRFPQSEQLLVHLRYEDIERQRFSGTMPTIAGRFTGRWHSHYQARATRRQNHAPSFLLLEPHWKRERPYFESGRRSLFDWSCLGC